MSQIEVIGAGFGRTGTMSLYTALNGLGYRTHHMKEVFHNLGQGTAWLKATRARAAGKGVDWQAALGGYTAAVDFPTVSFYKELLAINPNAKVILTLRYFESWYASALNTIYAADEVFQAFKPPFYIARLFKHFTDLFAMHRELLWDGVFGGRFTDKEYVRKVYEEHIAEVRRVVPPGQLLEFSVKEGWGPLCAFLGKPVPEEPFPRVNDTAEFQAIIRRVTALSRALSVAFLAANAAIAAAGVALVAHAALRGGVEGLAAYESVLGALFVRESA